MVQVGRRPPPPPPTQMRRGLLQTVMVVRWPLELAQWDFMLMGMKKDYCLDAVTPETHCHEKPMVSITNHYIIID